jgi:nitrate reductase beta subunit
MRSKRVDDRIDEQVLEKAGLSGDTVERMYRLLALARLEERFVLPTTPIRDEDIFIRQGDCGYGDAV